MHLVQVHSNTVTQKQILDIIHFCDSQSTESNYQYNHSRFQQPPNNWYSLMFRDAKFYKDFGGLLLAYDDDTLVGISGYYRSNIDPKIYIGSVRTLIHRQHRHKLLTTQLFIPAQNELVRSAGGACALWLFETEKEQTFYKIVHKQNVRRALDANSRGYKQQILDNTLILPYPISVNGKSLNAFAHILDKTWQFDFEKLKVVGL